MTLNETMNEIADAIREKTGKSELFKPIDFATEIKGITAGGGDGSGSNWRYFKLADGWGDNFTATQLLPAFMQLVNYVDSENNIISSGGILSFVGAPKETIKKIAFDANVKVSLQNQFYTWSEFLAGSGMSENEVIPMLNMTEITKEQFYDLNA